MNKRQRRALLGRIGVPGSVPRHLVDLMEKLGFTLIGADDLGHISRVVLRFDEGKYLTTLTLEDTE